MKELGLLLLAALGFDAGDLGRRAAALLADQPLIADTVPAIRELRGNRAGFLLVARETDPVDQARPPIDVVTVEGRYLGTISGQSLPNALGPDRLAAYVETDELDVQRISVRRLPASWFAESR